MTMLDGSTKKVEDIKIGDKLKGSGDFINTVEEYQPRKQVREDLLVLMVVISLRQKTTHSGQQKVGNQQTRL